jgi:tRNA pseudouridine38-40 synthase
MRHYRLTIQYDGTDFCGWQIQGRGERTVQGELTRALAVLHGSSPTVHGAGRTDSGVHAEGQVVSVWLERDLDPYKLRAAVNGNLPFDLRVISVEIAADDFNARFASTGKTYRYRVVNAPVMPPFWRRFALHEARPLGLAAMRECAPLFVGRHDWTAFSSAQSDVESRVRNLTELTIDTSPLEGIDGTMIEITVVGEGFLRYLVRGIVGALLAAARGDVGMEAITRALETGERPQLCATAAAHGLTLVKVHYD